MQYITPNDTVFAVRNVKIKFGLGVLSEIGYEASLLKIKSVLIVTDENINNNTNIVENCVKYLNEYKIDVEVYDKSPVEPIDTAILDAIEFAKNKTFDGIIGLGGGSSMDTAKMINLYTTYPTNDFKDYIAPPTGNGKPVPGYLKPYIAIPTTAGTGSENTPVAVVDLEKEKLKVGISSPFIQAQLALLDPTLTVTLSPYYTASTGLDALMHSIEAYTCIPYNSKPRPDNPKNRSVYVGSNPVSDMFVEESIKLIGEYLRRAYFNPHDIEAREKIMLAAHLGGAFGNAGVHIPHALAYPIAGRRHELPHGVTVVLTAPKSLEFIAPLVKEKLAKVAEWLGENVQGLSLSEAALKAKEGVRSLMKDLNIAKGLKYEGFGEEDMDDLSDAAMKIQRLLSMSPRTVTVDEIKEIYRGSMENW